VILAANSETANCDVLDEVDADVVVTDGVDVDLMTAVCDIVIVDGVAIDPLTAICTEAAVT